MTCKWAEKDKCAAMRKMKEVSGGIVRTIKEENPNDLCLNLGTQDMIKGQINIAKRGSKKRLLTPCIVAMLAENPLIGIHYAEVIAEIYMLKTGMPYTLEADVIKRLVR